jgi:hypothetical protein
MEEYNVTLDNPVLDPAFVTKANDFEEKLKSNQLTDEEIKATDDELVALFNAHDLSEEDSEEVKKAQRNESIANARLAITEASDVKVLTGLLKKYEDLPEVLPDIQAKITKLEKKAQEQANEKTEKENKEKRARLIEEGTKEIKDAKYENLQALGEKYKEFPELVKLVNDRHVAEKPDNDDEKLKATLLTKKEWSYGELKAKGIKPTGNDMTVAGVRMEKEYMLEVYRVRR